MFFAVRSRYVHENPSGLGLRFLHTVPSAERPTATDRGLDVGTGPITDLSGAVMPAGCFSTATDNEAADWFMKSSPTLASAFVLIVATYQCLRAGLVCLLVVACSGI
jgi:hypothetical protein